MKSIKNQVLMSVYSRPDFMMDYFTSPINEDPKTGVTFFTAETKDGEKRKINVALMELTDEISVQILNENDEIIERADNVLVNRLIDTIISMLK